MRNIHIFLSIFCAVLLWNTSTKAGERTASTWDLIRQAQSTEQAETEENNRIIRFPDNRSIGRIWIGEVTPGHWNIPYGAPFDYVYWEDYCPAQGEVKIPDGKLVKLGLDPWMWANPQNLSVLEQFEPDEFYSLFFNFNYLVGETGPDDRCMPYIVHLTELKSLHLMQTNVTAKGLEYLSEFKSLEQLSLPKGITNTGMVPVGKVTSLRDLHIGDDNNITGVGLNQISNLKSLEHLYLSSVRLRDERLEILSGLPKLYFLRISGNFSSDAIAYLKDVPSLKYLWIYIAMFNDQGMKNLAGITQLEGLQAHWMRGITDEGVWYIKDMPNLKFLEIGSAQLTDRALLALKEIPTLECLELPSSGFTDEGLKHIGELKNMKILRVCAGSDSILTDESLDYIGELENLEELCIGGRGFTDVGMQNLAKLIKLRLLFLHGNQNLTNKSFEALSGLKNLKLLNFGGLADFRNVNANINDDGLKHLSNLTDLEEISIGNCSFTDAGLQHFEGLTSLKRLYLTYSHVTDEGMAQFREKMPGLSN